MVFLGYIQDLNEDLPKQDDTAHIGAWLELREGDCYTAKLYQCAMGCFLSWNKLQEQLQASATSLDYCESHGLRLPAASPLREEGVCSLV